MRSVNRESLEDYEKEKNNIRAFIENDNKAKIVFGAIKKCFVNKIKQIHGLYSDKIYMFYTRDITKEMPSNREQDKRDVRKVAESLELYRFLKIVNKERNGNKGWLFELTPIGVKYLLKEKINLDEISILYDIDSNYVLGRREEIVNLKKRLISDESDEKNHHFLITGKSGIGKSTVVRVICNSERNKRQFIYLNMQNILKIGFYEEIKTELKKTLNIPESSIWTEDELKNFPNLNEFIITEHMKNSKIKHFFVFVDQCEKLFENEEENLYDLRTILRANISGRYNIHYVFITSAPDRFKHWTQNFENQNNIELIIKDYWIQPLNKHDIKKFETDLRGKLQILSYYWPLGSFPINGENAINILNNIFSMYSQDGERETIPFYYRLYLKIIFELTKNYYRNNLPNINLIDDYKYPSRILKRWIEQFINSLDEIEFEYLKKIVKSIKKEGFIDKATLISSISDTDKEKIADLLNMLTTQLRFLGPRSASRLSFQHEKIFELFNEHILNLPSELKNARKEFLVYHEKIRNYYDYPSKRDFEELHQKIHPNKDEIIDTEDELKTYVKLLVYFEIYETEKGLIYHYYADILKEIESCDFEDTKRYCLNNIDILTKNLIKFGIKENLIKGEDFEIILKITSKLVSSEFFDAYVEFMSNINIFGEMLENKKELLKFRKIVEKTLDLYHSKAKNNLNSTQSDGKEDLFKKSFNLIEQLEQIDSEDVRKLFLKQLLIFWLWSSKEDDDLNKIIFFIKEILKNEEHVKETLDLVWGDSDFITKRERLKFLTLLPIKFWVFLEKSIKNNVNLVEIIDEKADKGEARELFYVLLYYNKFVKPNKNFESKIYQKLCHQNVLYSLLVENTDKLNGLPENIKQKLKVSLDKTVMKLLKLWEDVAFTDLYIRGKDQLLKILIHMQTKLTLKEFVLLLAEISVEATEYFIRKIYDYKYKPFPRDLSPILELFELIYNDISNSTLRRLFTEILLFPFDKEKFSYLEEYYFKHDTEINNRTLDGFTESVQLVASNPKYICNILAKLEISKANSILELYIKNLYDFLESNPTANELIIHIRKISSFFQRKGNDKDFNMPSKRYWDSLVGLLDITIKQTISCVSKDPTKYESLIKECIYCLTETLKDLVWDSYRWDSHRTHLADKIGEVAVYLFEFVMHSEFSTKHELLYLFFNVNVVTPSILNSMLYYNCNITEHWTELLCNVISSYFEDKLFELISEKNIHNQKNLDYCSILYLAFKLDKKRIIKTLKKLKLKDSYYLLIKAPDSLVQEYVYTFKEEMIEDIRKNKELFFDIVTGNISALNESFSRELENIAKLVKFSPEEKYELIKTFNSSKSLIEFNKFLNYIIDGKKYEVDIFIKSLREKTLYKEEYSICKFTGNNVDNLNQFIEEHSDTNPYSLLLGTILSKNKELEDYVMRYITSEDDLGIRSKVLYYYIVVMRKKDITKLISYLINSINSCKTRDKLYFQYLESFMYLLEKTNKGSEIINKLFEHNSELGEKIVNTLYLIITTTKNPNNKILPPEIDDDTLDELFIFQYIPCMECPCDSCYVDFDVRSLRNLNKNLVKEVIKRILNKPSTDYPSCKIAKMLFWTYVMYKKVDKNTMERISIKKLIKEEINNFFQYYTSNLVKTKASLCSIINFTLMLNNLDSNEGISLLLDFLKRTVSILKEEKKNNLESVKDAHKPNSSSNKKIKILNKLSELLISKIGNYWNTKEKIKRKIYSTILKYLKSNDDTENDIGYKLLEKIVRYTSYEDLEKLVEILEITSKKTFFMEILKLFYENGKAKSVEEYLNKNGIINLTPSKVEKMLKLLSEYDFNLIFGYMHSVSAP